MTTAVAPAQQRSSHGSPLAEAVVHLARTFGRAPQAVWIYDLAGQCVYRNPVAHRVPPDAGRDSLEDILDGQNRPIGRLRVRLDPDLP
ncbi:MAG: hypothetical protein HRF43_04735 [Phycisphaerae bacterium]|jgi:hypothetical protein